MNSSLTWELEGKCRQSPDLFDRASVGVGEILPPDDAQAVKRICITCPVRARCLTEAMHEESYLGGAERHGVRGALTATERILLAAEDPMCSRCRQNPTAPAKKPQNIRTLCKKCQISTQNNLTARYFPPHRKVSTEIA